MSKKPKEKDDAGIIALATLVSYLDEPLNKAVKGWKNDGAAKQFVDGVSKAAEGAGEALEAVAVEKLPDPTTAIADRLLDSDN